MYKTYIFRYTTNYNMGMVVVNAIDLADAKESAIIAGAWDTNDVKIVDNSIQGIILDNADCSDFI